MATTLDIAYLKAGLRWDFESVQVYGNPTIATSFDFSTSFSNGTGAGKANKIYIAQSNTGIAATADLDIDLATLTDAYGNAIAITKVKIFYFENLAPLAATSALIHGGTSNPWAGASQMLDGTTPKLRVAGGGCFQMGRVDATGYVSDGTHSTIKITNESATLALPYRLVIVGE